VADVRLQAALEARQGAICDRWSKCSSTIPRTGWPRRWPGSAGPSWSATRGFSRTARDAEKHSPDLITEIPHQLTSPQPATEGRQGCSRTERRDGSCHLIQVTRRPVGLAAATDAGAVERRPCPRRLTGRRRWRGAPNPEANTAEERQSSRENAAGGPLRVPKL
jgi:hypothetical protein